MTAYCLDVVTHYYGNIKRIKCLLIMFCR